MGITSKTKIFLRNRLIPQLNRGPGSYRLQPPKDSLHPIPKIIHQLFPTKDLPEALANNVAKIKSINPDWEHRIYDHDDRIKYIKEHYGNEMLTYYERINSEYGAARADLFRYLLLYKHGGVYLDIKSTVTAPFNEVIQESDRYIITNSGPIFASHFTELANTPYGEILQWHIFSSPQHPFLKVVIESVLRNIDIYSPTIHGVGRYGVFRLTGPVAYSLAIGPLLNSYPSRLCNYKSDLGLIYSIFDNVTEHRKLFKSHYALLKNPIVAQTGINKVREDVFHLAKKVKDALSHSH